MVRFFFDIDDGKRHSWDSEGTELASRMDARREAVNVLPDVAREVLPDGDERHIVCRVRDENGKVIFTATLSLKAGWTTGEGPDASPN